MNQKILKDLKNKIMPKIEETNNKKTNRKILVNNIQQNFMVWLQNYIWTKDTNMDQLGIDIEQLIKEYELKK
tara:strand:+ start:277 stop:492 length:216 start_codon:yes stop_codon:yes gene_type:complete